MMAVVNASYVRKGVRERAVARQYLSYISHRAGADGAKMARELWNGYGSVRREDGLAMVEQAPEGCYFYRLSIDPHPTIEDTRRDLHLRSLTEGTIEQLERTLGTELSWVATVHDDHTDKRHVHLLAILPRRLGRADLVGMISESTALARGQRRILDATHEKEQRRRERVQDKEWDREQEL
jgi:hypothetical protein